MYAIAATWATAYPAVEETAPRMPLGLSAEDACEIIARYAEDAPEDVTVGSTGLLNADGDLELDAAFMEGTRLRIGGVAGLREIRNPVSVARKVMTESPHNLIIGQGALAFALSHGFAREQLITEQAQAAYEEWRKNPIPPLSHDTVGVVALDETGHMAVATSTSGIAYKHPGRVSDSALIGNGFYVDENIGGVVCTGVGEDIMRGCFAAVAMDLLREGVSAQAAAKEAIDRLVRRVNKVGDVALIVMDKHGNIGAYASHPKFQVSLATTARKPELWSVPI